MFFLCAFVLLATLFFGLKPKGFRFSNQVEPLGEGKGLAFTNFGMVYSRRPLGDAGISDSLCLAFTIKPYGTGRRLSKIISVVDEKGRSLLEVEQWMTTLLVTLWAPDGGRKGRVGIEGALSADSFLSAVVSVDGGELSLSVDESRGLRRGRTVEVPGGFFANCRVLIGLSPTGRNPWRGEMTELGIFPKRAPVEEISDFQARPLGRFGLHAFTSVKPAALYYFGELAGRTIRDRSGNGWDLELPAYPRLFKHEVLTVNPGNTLANSGLEMDMIINYFGFLPFGACFFAFFHAFTGSRRRAAVFTVGCAFITSLGIELAQVFIPTRTSQLLDIVLNTAGALSGAAATLAVTRKKRGPQENQATP